MPEGDTLPTDVEVGRAAGDAAGFVRGVNILAARFKKRELCRTPIPPGPFIDDLPRDVPDEETAPGFSGE
jgi:hypothetical protein